jgi:hypothetical protein
VKLVVVCARSYEQALAWAQKNGVTRSRMYYASSPAKVLGLHDFEIVRLRGFYSRADADEIDRVLRAAELKRAAFDRAHRHVEGG